MLAWGPLVAAKRSPILGYNHNVRFRGIVFHIQTEDSGIVNPHVFSHLFHGGVILSSRKLVYDAGSDEDAVKSLMQAQHKAVMKDLRRGTFDDKIDAYLADAPGLLPRESERIATAARVADELAVSDALAASDAQAALAAADFAAGPPDDDAFDPPTSPSIELIEPELTPPAMEAVHPRANDVTEPVPTLFAEAVSAPIELVNGKPPPREARPPEAKQSAILVEDDDLFDAAPMPELARAATERFHDSMPVPRALGETPPSARTEISAALHAIQVSDEDLAAAFADDSPAQIHSPALPSAPTPPGAQPERVGEYRLARKQTASESPSAPVRPPIPRATPVASRVPTPSARPPVPTARLPTQPDRVTPAPTPPPATRAPPPIRSQTPSDPAPRAGLPSDRRAGTPPYTSPPLHRPTPQHSSVPRAMTTPPRPPTGETPGVARPTIAPPRRPTSGGGVVVSRPAVIVGGKSPTAAPAKVRRAKDADSFGGDLISERSLDEVILAYLSEDNSED